MEFVDRLEYIIKKSKLKRNEFAEKCGISRTQLFRYLKSQQEPGTLFYRNLKINFPWVNIGWLITGSKDKDEKTDYIESKAMQPEKINELTDYLLKLETNSPMELNEVEEFLKYRLSVSDKKKDK